MADFVAVIRRAVDGLTENTPEMRAKVYEKAKGAVVRQLENMKPRPPEVMFKRQLDKLDDAIRQVEEEHSEALPADKEDASVAEQAVESASEPAEVHAEEPASIQPTYAESDSAHHDLPAEAVTEAPAQADEPVHHDVHPTQTPAYHEAEPAGDVPQHHELPAAHVEPAHEDSAAEHTATATNEPVAGQEDPVLAHADPVHDPARSHAANRVMEHPFAEPESEFPGDEPHIHDADKPQSAMPDWGVDIDREPETAVAEEQPQPQMPRATLSETDVATGFNAFLKEEFSTPAVPPPPSKKGQEGDFSWDAPFDDLPDLPKPVAFEEALEAKQREIDSAPAETAKEIRQKNARSELEDLIGYTGDASAGENGDGSKLPPEVSRAMSKLEGKSFKVHKKNKKRSSFNPLPIAIGVAAALIVACGAYGLYHYRDDVSALVAQYMPASATDKTAATKSAEDTAAADAKGAEDAAKTEVDGKPTEVASLDPNIAPTKFTQRLLSDGTETETDAAKIPVDQTLKEGKTIAGQTEVGDQVASTDAATPATTSDRASTDTNSLAATQKMFLYEEQLSGSPVAVPGKVTWSIKNDTASTGDKKQSMIEANIDVPDRKLKALMTFKRNTDASLPASHIIEIVFDLPENFAEGNVESVQRIAFKQTEQDRGNGLIAVPAKITDDFHMVALNNDADARKVNGDLMKTRSWIDIPITYRNNRRALITLEKGATGTEAFDKVLAEWNALGAQVNNN